MLETITMLNLIDYLQTKIDSINFSKEDEELLKGLLFIYVIYWFLILWLVFQENKEKILYYLDKPFTTLDLDKFVFDSFVLWNKKLWLDLFQKEPIWSVFVEMDNGDIVLKRELSYDEMDNIKEEKKWKYSKLALVYFMFLLFLQENLFNFNWLFSFLDKDEISQLKILEEVGYQDIKEILNFIKRMEDFINENKDYLNEFIQKEIDNVINYIEKNSDKKPLEELIYAYFIRNIPLDPVFISMLNSKWLEIKEGTYKWFLNNNFFKNYFLLLFSQNIENKPFFKPYIDYFKRNATWFIQEYYNNKQEEIINLWIKEDHKNSEYYNLIQKIVINNFNPFDKKSRDSYLEQIDNNIIDRFRGLTYLDFQTPVLAYLSQNNNYIDNIRLEIVWLAKKWIDFYGSETIKLVEIIYKLYIDDKLVEEKRYY